MDNYLFPIIMLSMFVILLIVNITKLFLDYKKRLLTDEDNKISLIPNIVNIILILIGIGLACYEFYVIYSQLHS